jgi:tetratricopeptide (TPR) repeat protein
VDRALLLARQEAWKVCQKRDDPSWTLPVLYSATNQGLIFDPNPQRSIDEPLRPMVVQEALPGMKEGYAEHFVGRRREQQRLLPALRSGDLQILIITGLGGSGKSALATRLARKLETYGLLPIPVSSSQENPLNSARLLEAFGDAFREAARKHRSEGAARKGNELDALVHDLRNPDLLVEDRLHDAVGALNRGQFLLLLDNFESNLDESDRRILDAEISEFYKYLVSHLTGSSRAIITTRYPPSDVPTLPPKVHKEDLSDFAESSFFKIMQRDLKVEQRIRSKELPAELLRDLYRKFGGTPRFLLQIREAIKDMDAQKLAEELAKVELPSDAQAGELQKLRDQYFDDIFTQRLYGFLSPKSQMALSRSSVYGVPMTFEGLAAVTGATPEVVEVFAKEWQDRAFAYQETGMSLWSVYGLLRGWLLAQLSEEEQKNAHKKAGDSLVELDQQDREGELGLSWIDCSIEARSMYLNANELELARQVTGLLSNFFTRSGFYDGVRLLNYEMLDYEEHPDSMGWIARTYSDQGDYDSAQGWYQRSLKACSDSDVENISISWHGLATIDVNRGDYDQAVEKFQKSLKITQEIGRMRLTPFINSASWLKSWAKLKKVCG